MTDLICPGCKRRVSETLFRATPDFCPFCGLQGPLTSEPERYVDGDDPGPGEPTADSLATTDADFLEPIEEIVQFSWRETLVRIFWFYVSATARVTVLITAVFVALGLLFVIAGAIPVARLAGFPLTVALFFGFSWCVVSVVGIPISVLWTLRGRKRRIRVVGSRFIVERGARTIELKLSDCRWMTSKAACDLYGAYSPGRPLVVVCCANQSYACGFSQEKREAWERYLTIAKVPRVHSEWRRAVLGLGLGGAIGGTVGAGVGLALKALGADAMLVVVAGFLGMIDGAIIAGMYLGAVERWHPPIRRTSCTLMAAGAFAMFALMLGGGVKVVAIVVPVNAVIGATAAWFACALAERHRRSDSETRSGQNGGDLQDSLHPVDR